MPIRSDGDELDRARSLDEQDELAPLRAHFHIPPGVVYLDGNSLGLWSEPAERSVRQTLEQWRLHGVAGWTDAEPPWFTLAEELGRRMAELVGAEPDELVVTNSTTVNLHQLLATLYDPRGPRNQILVDELIFPSDLYAIRSHLAARGLDPTEALVVVRSREGYTLDERELIEAMTDRVQIAILPSVLYVSGQLLDLAALAAEANERGVVIAFDCSHSVGAIPHLLDDWGVDYAFWCGYKYLNAGPGAAAALYLNRRHFGKAPGMAGWFGSRKEAQFDLSPLFVPAAGAGALQIGTPNILSMAALAGTLTTIEQAGIDGIRRKSLALSQYMIDLADAHLTSHGFTLVTPREPMRRGGHVALAHPEALRICAALRARGVIPDFRPPHVVRLAPVALYTTFADCLSAIVALAEIGVNREFEELPSARGLVT